LALTGCGEDTPPDNATGTGATGEVVESESDAGEASETDSAKEDDPEGEPVPEASEQDLVGATCLPGDWVLDNASMKALFTAAGGDIVEVSGEVLTSYRADGTWLTQYTEWTTVAKDAEATTTMVRNGDDHGTYRVADDSGLTLVT